MNLQQLRQRIESLVSHVYFDYNGKDCCVDPINHKSYFLVYDGETMEAKSIDEVMNAKFFDGKSLVEIFDELENFEY